MPKMTTLLLLGLFLAAGCGDDDDDAGGDGDADGDGDGDGDGDEPACGNGVVDGAEECEGLAGCDEGDVCTDDCTCAPFPDKPATSQDLIEQALAAGTIDYPTSLLYRVWALFQAPELPEEFDGIGTSGEDTQLFFEIAAERASLPADVEDAIAPYVVRPDDPTSLYSQTTVPIGGGAGDPPPVLCPANDQGLADWRYHETPNRNFVVWSCGGGQNGPDTYANARVVAGEAFEDAWTAMFGGGVGRLPPPRNDNYPNGPSPVGRIDVYLLELNQCRNRRMGCAQEIIQGKELAAAIPDLPCDASGPATSSGYVVVKAGSVPAANGPGRFRNTAAHELFHLASYGMNLNVQGNTCAPGAPAFPAASGADSWLSEASAEWASHYFFPDDDRARRTALFAEFQGNRDNARIGLQTTIEGFDYDAFLYPAFIQEETGAGDILINLWTGSQSVTTPAAFDDRLDSLYSFQDHFRDFSVRNFNRQLHGSPIVPHSSFDGALPFGGEAYESRVVKPGLRFGPDRREVELPIRIAPLAMQTDYVEFEPELQWIKFDATAGGGGRVSLDALVQVDGQWERRRLNQPILELCRDNEGDEEMEAAYLIFSNFSHDPNGRLEGFYDVETGPACPGGWSGRLRVVTSIQEAWEYDDANGHHSLDSSFLETHEWILNETRTEDDEEIIDATWHYSLDTTSTAVTPNLGCARTTTTVGHGSGDGDSAFRVLFADNLVQTLQPWGDGNEATVESHTDVTDCEGSSGYDQPPGTQYEDFALFGAPDFSFLQTDADQPQTFNGSTTIFHDDDGQGRITEITGHWAITRRPLDQE